MSLGWTQNIVILESDLTIQERLWYIRAALRFGWSKSVLAQQMGLLPFSSCSIPDFSMEEFTPRRFRFADGLDGLWEWRLELVRVIR